MVSAGVRGQISRQSVGAEIQLVQAVSQKPQGVACWYSVGILVGRCRCVVLWGDLDLTFNFAI